MNDHSVRRGAILSCAGHNVKQRSKSSAAEHHRYRATGADADDDRLSSARPAADKREAILAAALRLIARTGLHNTPISAVAREAGVAAGTLYLYFPSKEAMINALYLEVYEDRSRALAIDGDPGEDLLAGMWRVWQSLARWDLDHPEASNFLLQCQASGILTQETRDSVQRIDAAGKVAFEDVVARGLIRKLSQQVFWALFSGPIVALARMRDAGELEITDEVLRATFDGVCRSVVPSGP